MKNEHFEVKNKWIVLLTMCVKPNQQDRKPNENIDDIINYRRVIYNSNK